VTLLFAVVSTAAAGEKTDILVMDNGDKITGELKSVRQGQLSYKTDNLGTLTVNWDSVASLVSNKTVEVEMDDGSLHYGILVTPSKEGNLALQSDTGVNELALGQVVRINPIHKGFLKGLDGSFSVGASFTKSSDVLQVSVSGDVNRRRRKSYAKLIANAISTGQEDGTTQNINLALTYTRLHRNRWLAGGVGAY